MLYKARITQKSTGYGGELSRGNVIECQLNGYKTKRAAQLALNRHITAYNLKHDLGIPHLKENQCQVEYHTNADHLREKHNER